MGIGTTFTNGKPSPYDVNIIQAPDNISVQQINELVDKFTEPEEYNKVIKLQYRQMDENGWWLESEKYVKMLTEIL